MSKGQGRTKAGEKERRIDYAFFLLCKGYPIYYIKKSLMGTFHVTARPADDYLAHARRILAAEANMEVDEYRHQSLLFYMRKAAVSVDERVQLIARSKADKLMGIVQPAPNVNINMPGSTVNQIDLSDEEKFNHIKEQRVQQLMSRFTMMQIEKAKQYGVPLHEDLKQLTEKIEEVTATPVPVKPTKKSKKR